MELGGVLVPTYRNRVVIFLLWLNLLCQVFFLSWLILWEPGCQVPSEFATLSRQVRRPKIFWNGKEYKSLRYHSLETLTRRSLVQSIPKEGIGSIETPCLILVSLLLITIVYIKYIIPLASAGSHSLPDKCSNLANTALQNVNVACYFLPKWTSNCFPLLFKLAFWDGWRHPLHTWEFCLTPGFWKISNTHTTHIQTHAHKFTWW